MFKHLIAAVTLLGLSATAHATDYNFLASGVPGQSSGSYKVTLRRSPDHTSWQIAYITPSVGPSVMPSTWVSQVRIYFYDASGHNLGILGTTSTNTAGTDAKRYFWGPALIGVGGSNPAFRSYAQFTTSANNQVLYNDGRNDWGSLGTFIVSPAVASVTIQLGGKAPFVGSALVP